MDINGEYIKEYYSIMKNTSLQRSYQEFIKFFKYLRIYLEKEMAEYKFTGNIIENNMDYSYFQFSDEELKSKGLKIVVVFIHKLCNYEVWLSGLNREIQVKYYNKLIKNHKKYSLTTNPEKFDYILKNTIYDEENYDNVSKMLIEMKNKILSFINDVKKL
jgi:hypothetical protein